MELAEDWNNVTLFFLALQLVMAFRCFQEYHRFAPERLARSGDNGEEAG